MRKMTRELNPTEVKYGLLYISELRQLFPEPSQPITIIDEDGAKFISKMHSFQPRIDGLTRLHRKHNTQAGQSIIIEVNEDTIGTAYFKFQGEQARIVEPGSTESSEEAKDESLFITASLESMLEDFIATNLNALEPNLTLFIDEDGIPGRQYFTDVGTIDLLCVDAAKNLVVIELKRGRASDKVVGQISRYIGWVKENIAKGFRDTRGIVVVHKPTERYPRDDRLYYAVLANPKLELRYYEISLSFFERGKTF